MATAVKLPELGENVEQGNVVSVLVKEGDTIARDDSVIEIETDKATIEVPSTAAGVVRKVAVKSGDTVKVGQVLVEVDESGSGAKAAPSKGAADAAAKVEEKAARAPEKSAKAAAPARTAPEAETDEAEPEPSRPAPAPAPARAAAPAPAPASARTDRSPANVPASPSVRRFAHEIGVDITQVKGSGPAGRISVEDVKQHSRQGGGGPGASVPVASISSDLPDFSRYGEIDVRPMSTIRAKIAENMARSWSQVAHVTQFDRCDITDIEAFRQAHKARVEAAGGKLTLTAIVVKVVAAALRAFPQFNASVDAANRTIILKHYVNVGVAVDTEHGLLVPVIRNADRKSITEIAVELTALSVKARHKKLSLEDLHGGSFTITNLGGIGGTGFTPIVNWPEVAILGIARSAYEPVYENGAFVPRLTMPVSLSYDHRVIDGADGVRFTRFLDDALRHPLVMML
jgi:pyruvate dehydrogenase E2 component (dihydrolipoamide acetyltransferase)